MVRRLPILFSIDFSIFLCIPSPVPQKWRSFAMYLIYMVMWERRIGRRERGFCPRAQRFARRCVGFSNRSGKLVSRFRPNRENANFLTLLPPVCLATQLGQDELGVKNPFSSSRCVYLPYLGHRQGCRGGAGVPRREGAHVLEELGGCCGVRRGGR